MLRKSTHKLEKATKGNIDSNEYAYLKIRYKLPDSDKSTLLTTPVSTEYEYTAFDKVPTDIRFASAVAAFGQLLKGDSHLKDLDYDDIIKIASDAKGQDFYGYRAEFINLVRLAKSFD